MKFASGDRVKVKGTKFDGRIGKVMERGSMAGRWVVDLGGERKQLAEERDEQNKALAEEHMEERNKWMRRFQMQQETIEGLENDVEELSELKVLELAENYYVSTQNGYN